MQQKKRLIDVYEAAKMMGCKVHNVWALIRRLSLKAVKRNDKLMTCEEWIDEYHENKRSKDLHSVFNGRKVFDEAEGELSIAMCAKELGVSKCNVNYYVRTGRLRTFRKGHYHVILRSEFERFVSEEMHDKQQLVENA